MKTLEDVLNHKVFKSHYKKHLEKYSLKYTDKEKIERFNHFLKTHNKIEEHNADEATTY